MRLTENDIVSRYDFIEGLITKHSQLNIDAFASELMSTVVSDVPLSDFNECNLQYSGGSMENRMWSLALISISWLLNDLKRKAEDGHCQNTSHSHGNKTPRLCQSGSKFHRDLYDGCLKLLEEILQSAKNNRPNITTSNNQNIQ
jgi:hypothetical protein